MHTLRFFRFFGSYKFLVFLTHVYIHMLPLDHLLLSRFCRPLHTPTDDPEQGETAIQHFHDKLLHIHQRLKTAPGKEMGGQTTQSGKSPKSQFIVRAFPTAFKLYNLHISYGCLFPSILLMILHRS